MLGYVPLVVSQLLPMSRLFDVATFDEASRVTPQDAVRVIARAERVVVAGDPKQSPQINLLAPSGGGVGEGDAEAVLDTSLPSDVESVLDQMAALLPRLSEPAPSAGTTAAVTSGSSLSPTPRVPLPLRHDHLPRDRHRGLDPTYACPVASETSLRVGLRSGRGQCGRQADCRARPHPPSESLGGRHGHQAGQPHRGDAEPGPAGR